MSFRLFVPKQAVGLSLVYFDLFNALGSASTIYVRSLTPVVSGEAIVTGVLAVDLFLTRTTAVGTTGTAATNEGTSLTAATFTHASGTSIVSPSITARLTPGGGATAGAVICYRSVFTEETSAGTYTPAKDMIDDGGLLVREGTGIRVVQGGVASVGNIGFDVVFDVVLK